MMATPKDDGWTVWRDVQKRPCQISGLLSLMVRALFRPCGGLARVVTYHTNNPRSVNILVTMYRKKRESAGLKQSPKRRQCKPTQKSEGFLVSESRTSVF